MLKIICLLKILLDLSVFQNRSFQLTNFACQGTFNDFWKTFSCYGDGGEGGMLVAFSEWRKNTADFCTMFITTTPPTWSYFLDSNASSSEVSSTLEPACLVKEVEIFSLLFRSKASGVWIFSFSSGCFSNVLVLAANHYLYKELTKG